MHEKQFQDEVFENATALVVAAYDNCVFKSCDFSEATFSGIQFSHCVFEHCNLSLAQLDQTAFQVVTFKGCKLLGLLFYTCQSLGFSVAFKYCQMQHASFYNMKLKKTPFLSCSLQEVDFTNADLSQAIFDDCDLTMAMFDATTLDKADLSTAYNFTIDPEQNSIKNAKFSRNGLEGLLLKYGLNVVD